AGHFLGREALAVLQRNQRAVDPEHGGQTGLEVDVARATAQRNLEDLVEFHWSRSLAPDPATPAVRAGTTCLNAPLLGRGKPPTGRQGRRCPAISPCSAFAELEPAAGAGLAVLLALHHARVAGEEAGLLQRGTEFRVQQAQSAAEPVPDRA